eukprot:TRINITY_DN4080_c0_g1_i1.p1 TRINITY_DN4080_c0_g1~~TRINITY_DN4080_c0_g1_i1.p1  ORF type:complete len:163 (-),score=38.97 TRINITY_DN4080_c0_g1_i1:319-807(-)
MAAETASRKRRPGASEVVAASVSNFSTEELLFEEVRLPASTMLFCPREAYASESLMLPGSEEDFYLSHEAARRANAMETLRILQCKPQRQLRLLQGASSASTPGRQALLEEAEARGLDGFLLPGERAVLLESNDQAILIDDDKKEGLTQQLLTDMFLKMSLT